MLAETVSLSSLVKRALTLVRRPSFILSVISRLMNSSPSGGFLNLGPAVPHTVMPRKRKMVFK